MFFTSTPVWLSNNEILGCADITFFFFMCWSISCLAVSHDVTRFTTKPRYTRCDVSQHKQSRGNQLAPASDKDLSSRTTVVLLAPPKNITRNAIFVAFQVAKILRR
ncbi:hypothetical protein GHT06_014837 [Daphnia sinensis]|uniref:Uncharacterized protein n=1 Tax=Daphnia sinensis TaxID=1820382 RepID=A0AAD5KRK5_9CRUS|nr:hypothetical protein GHT06_014837 [Daphnia sinensis]